MKVLIVDDDADIRRVLGDRLRALDCEVLESAGGPEALALLDRMQVQGVLLDMNLPEMDGLAVLRVIHAKAPHVPVIVMSALHNKDILKQAIREGAMDYLLKPIQFEDLIEKVQRLFG